MSYVIGYVFRSETYCHGECVTEVLIRQGRLSPAARFMTTPENLEAVADVEALDSVEIRDSETLPQPVDSRSDDLMGHECAWCAGEIDAAPEYLDRCPACGDPSDHCSGHGEIGDPRGAAILAAHDSGDHSRCHGLSDCPVCPCCSTRSGTDDDALCGSCEAVESSRGPWSYA